jgi:hypothetical protein
MQVSRVDACGFDLLDLPEDPVTPIGSGCRHAGTWRWEFSPIGDRRESDERSYEFQLRHEGVIAAYGTAAATDTQVTIIDQGGRWSCIPSSRFTARYEWTRHDNELRFVTIDDPCLAYRAPLTIRPWAKVT